MPCGKCILEEPAFDLLRMVAPPEQVGLGDMPNCRVRKSSRAFAQRCKKEIEAAHGQIVGNPGRNVRTLALWPEAQGVCAG